MNLKPARTALLAAPHKVLAACWLLLPLLLMLLLAAPRPALAQGAAPGRDFDHTRTGFVLSGAHVKERCESCHVGGIFKGTPRDCATCHTSGSRFATANTVKPVRHIPTSPGANQGCDSCHSTQSFAGARFSHASVVSGSCSTCHNGNLAPGKPVGHPPTQAACDSCHRSTGTWAGAKADHATFTAATNCSSCHNGSGATGKPATHIPVAATNCIACHSTTSWQPSRFNHTQVAVAGQCASCHSGSYPPADGRPARHIPYQTLTGAAINNCDSCHKAGTTAWTPARLHSNVPVSTQCALCHSGSYPPAVGKPPTPVHNGVTVCESCHRSTSSWTAVSFAHSAANAVGTGTCDSCHNGAAATGKTAAHIPVPAGAARCDSCHRSQSSFSTAVTMNHALVSTAQCKTCHNGSYLAQGNNGGAMAKPANHIPELQLLNGAALDCAACHTGTTSWAAPRMNHNNSLGGGAGWCKACHASGTNFLGSMEKKSLTHERKTPPAIDCSESGCHRPLGNKGAAYSKWD